MFSLGRFICTLGLFPLGAMASEPYLAILELYEGRWVGHFTVHSPATDYTETFPVEQQYWLEEDVLRGVAVIQRESGMESVRSTTEIQKGKLFSETKKTDGTVERFIGTAHDKGIVWIPADLERAQDYQIKETFTVEDGKRVLKTEGFDTYVYSEGLTHLVYRGELVLTPEQ